MKFSTLLKNEFSGEYWTWQNVLNITTNEVETIYTKSRDITFSVLPASKGALFLLHEDQLQYNGQIRELKDGAGKYIFVNPGTGEPLVAYLGISEPHFDTFGELNLWRHDLSQGFVSD